MQDTNELPPAKLRERYSRLDRLSAGGMGVVFKGEDEILKKTVAIKTLFMKSADPDAVIRFQQEARAVSRLSHPNIIGIMDFGLLDDSQPYLVMDFVDGMSLGSFMEQSGPLDPEIVIEILCQVCDGMSHAHERGVIHRDLKPSNLMLEGNPAEQIQIRILDFGVAKLEESQAEETGFQTRTGTMVGSPYYMSPEQIRAEAVDARSDIYSLGCIAYQMVSGTRPFDGETYVQTVTAHLELPPAMLVAREDKSGALNSVILKCLAKNPDERFASMTELKEALLACRAEEPLPVPVRKEIPAPLVAASILLLILIVGGLGFSQLSKKEEPILPVRPVVEAVKPELEKFTVTREKSLESWAAINDPIEPVNDDNLKLIKGDHVSELDLTNAEITSAGLENLVGLDLRVLLLAKEKIDDQAGPILARIPGLLYVRFDNCAVTYRCLEAMKPLKLQCLSLQECKGVDDRALSVIVKSWPDLRMLDIGGTAVSQEGLNQVASLEHLRDLNVSIRKVTPENMEAICKLPLKSLDLTLTSMTTETLSRVKSIKTLETLVLNGCSALDLEGAQRLGKEMPGVKISFVGLSRVETGKLGDYVEFLAE
ncbi:MAG: protein kinase [Candidatus Melainabacteria bacterium]|nr:protein kinase [Candidatus Melainabacteria bacterium]